MKRLLCVLMVACLASGCALTTDRVNVEYKSMTSKNEIPGAGGDAIQVDATEGRVSDLDKISVKKNGYGMEMAPIVSNTPIPDLLKSAIEEELSKEGFRVGPGKVFVDAEVDKFYNDFKIGFFSGEAVSEVTIAVDVKTTDGRILYARTLTGEGNVGGVMIADGENAKLSLEKAFSAAVARLVSDQNFTQALLNASTSPGAPVS